MSSPEMDQILNALQNAEELAESILSDRQEIIEMDKKRNKNREALRLLKTNYDNKVSRNYL